MTYATLRRLWLIALRLRCTGLLVSRRFAVRDGAAGGDSAARSVAKAMEAERDGEVWGVDSAIGVDLAV